MSPEILRHLAEELIPFNRMLGLRAETIERGRVVFAVPFRDDLIGDPYRRALHGGVISMLADTAGGFAVWSCVDDPRVRISTIDLRVDYLQPGREDALVAEATIVRAGNTVGVADVRLYQPSDEARTIATGKGVYALRRAKTSLEEARATELGPRADAERSARSADLGPADVDDD